MVLLAVKAFAGSKVQLIPAIRTEQKPSEQSLPFRFCGTAFVFSQLLHPVPLSLRNDASCVSGKIHISSMTLGIRFFSL